MFLKTLFCAAFLFVSVEVNAAPNCRPYFNEGTYTSVNEEIGWTKTGVWLYWECIDIPASNAANFPIFQANVTFTRFDYGTKQSIGGKIDTAISSLTQFISSWKRNVVTPTTDPSFADIKADFLSHHPELTGKL